MENYHITKSEKGWELKKAGATRASKKAETKAEIIKLSIEFLNGKTASLKIHKEDGTIQKSEPTQEALTLLNPRVRLNIH